MRHRTAPAAAGASASPIRCCSRRWPASAARAAAAVTQAGGLGILGGSYGGGPWLEAQLQLTGDTLVGVGFITWALEQQPQVAELMALAHRPRAIFLSVPRSIARFADGDARDSIR